MNSPTHRANLLNDGFRDQGMGLTFGDASAGRYHSVVANTFGTLAIAKAAAPAASLPSPAKPQPVTSVPKPAPRPAPTVPVATPPAVASSRPGPSPISPRGEFALNSKSGENPPPAPSEAPTSAAPTETGPAVVNSQAAPASQLYQANRYFGFAFGLALLLFLIVDLQKMVETQWQSLDKKINNIFVLFLAVVVIAVLYLI